MSNPADESTQATPVKIKKTRKKYNLNPEKDKRFKGNGQRTEAQKTAQFKEGNQEAIKSRGANTAKRNRAFRENCFKILNEAALPMLVNRLYDSHEALETKHFIEILKFLTLYGIGKPLDMIPDEEQTPEAPQFVNNIVITKEMLDQAYRNDDEHLNG